MVVPKINSAHGSDTRNIINRHIEVTNSLGRAIQNLVAKGQLTPSQYADLIKEVNSNIQRIEFNQLKLESDATVQAIFKKLKLEEMGKIENSNMWQTNDVTSGNLSVNTGDVVPSDSNYVSNFQKVEPATSYTFYADGLDLASAFFFRLAYYDKNHVYISAEEIGPIDPNVGVTKNTPSNAYYRKVAVSRSALNTFSVVKGSTPFPNIKDGTEINGFWDDIPRPPLVPNSIENFHVKERVITPEKTNFFKIEKNLFNKDSVVLNKSFDNATGELVDDVRWASLEFIPITQGETISLNADSALRVATYREDFSFISRSGTTAPPTKFTSTSSIARYIRFSGTHDPELLMINRGEELLPYEPYGDVIKSEYLPKMQAEDIDTTTIKEDIINELAYINAKNPYPPKLSNLIEVHQGPETPLWLSGDGEVLYGRGRQGSMPVMSTDEWETHQQIGTSNLPAYIYGMRELPSGELMASVSRNESLDIRAKVFKTTGFDRSDPSTAVWNEVLEVGSRLANVQNSWGFDSYGDIVVIAEYGLQGIDGSRYVYLSTDGGNEFTQIFDLVNEIVEGRPNWDSDAHLHTVAYDPYFSRIWLCVGDGLNSATYYTDNYGGKWEHVEQGTAMQYTGIIAMEDSVIFGSDRAPNGVYIYRRKDKAEKVKINPWHILNDEQGISQIFQLPFRRDRNKGTPVYFNATSSKQANDPNETVVMAFIDGKKAHLIYQSEPIHSLTNGSGVTAALGDTSQGNVILVVNMPDQSGSTTYKVAAPIWE